MNKELKLQIRKKQTRAVLSLIATVGIFVFGGFGILLLFVPSWIAVLFFAVAIMDGIYLVYAGRRANEVPRKPILLQGTKRFPLKRWRASLNI